MQSKSASVNLVSVFNKELKTLLFFPLWWYSHGLANVIKSSFDFFVNSQRSLAFLVWVKNIFVPMYGQEDFQGRIISFFIRVIQIIFRGFSLVIVLIFSLVFIFIWVFLPLFLIYQIINQI